MAYLTSIPQHENHGRFAQNCWYAWAKKGRLFRWFCHGTLCDLRSWQVCFFGAHRRHGYPPAIGVRPTKNLKKNHLKPSETGLLPSRTKEGQGFTQKPTTHGTETRFQIKRSLPEGHFLWRQTEEIPIHPNTININMLNECIYIYSIYIYGIWNMNEYDIWISFWNILEYVGWIWYMLNVLQQSKTQKCLINCCIWFINQLYLSQPEKSLKISSPACMRLIASWMMYADMHTSAFFGGEDRVVNDMTDTKGIIIPNIWLIWLIYG